MKVIQRELSDMNGGAEDDVAEIEKRLAEADLPEHVRKKPKLSSVNLKQCSLHLVKLLWYVTIRSDSRYAMEQSEQSQY